MMGMMMGREENPTPTPPSTMILLVLRAAPHGMAAGWKDRVGA